MVRKPQLSSSGCVVVNVERPSALAPEHPIRVKTRFREDHEHTSVVEDPVEVRLHVPHVLPPKSLAAGPTLPQTVLFLQPVLRCWAGRCRTCQRSVDLKQLLAHSGEPSASTDSAVSKAAISASKKSI